MVTKTYSINMLVIFVLSFVLLFLLEGCSSSFSEYIEVEQTVKMTSFFNENVRKAFADNIETEINASYLNLETGETTKETDPDIIYRLSCGSTCWPAISGTENVKLDAFGENQPSRQECEDLLKSQRLGRGDIVAKNGWYTCIQTSEGQMGWIRYDKDFRTGLDKETSEIQITYWIWGEKQK